MKITNKNLQIIFMGTPEFSAIILEKMIDTGYKPVMVITAPDKPVGRKQILTPSKTKLLAIKNKIPVLQPEKIIDSKSSILNSKPDLIVLAAYGQIIPKEILEIPQYGCLNIHPSLLPKYRGASPIQTVILNGDLETGVTIILMDEKLDHGPILRQRKKEITNNKITTEELTKELAKLGAELLIETLPKWLKGEIKPTPQNHLKATYTKIFKKEDGHINWKNPAEFIERQIRALNPWPGTYGYFKNQILKIIEADVFKTNHKKKPGTVFLTEKKELAVACQKNALILKKIQLEGKKQMTAKEFFNGHREIVGLKIL